MSTQLSPLFDRRGFLTLAGLGIGAAALAGCAGPSTSAADAPATEADLDFSGVKPAAEITFWSNHPGKSQEVEKKIIEKFHAAQSDIKVNLVTAGSNYEEVAQKFQVAGSGTDLPDIVVFSDVWWFRYFLAKSIIPLDELFVAVDEDPATYRKGLFADYQYDGKQWAVPYARSTPLFYYNKDQFKAAGVPDRAPKTWAEFAEWAPKIQSANASVSGFKNAYYHPAPKDYAGWTFQNLLWGEGGGWSSEWSMTADSEANVKVFQFAQDSVYKDKWAGVSSDDVSTDIASGAVAASLSSTGSLVGVQKAAKAPIGVGFLPGGSVTESPVCPTGGAGLGIPREISKERQLAAATFLKFLTSPENTVEFSAATGYMPVRENADTSTLLAANPLIGTAIEQLAVTRPQDYARVFLPGGDLKMADASGAILTRQADVASTLGTLKTDLEKIYSSQVKPELP